MAGCAKYASRLYLRHLLWPVIALATLGSSAFGETRKITACGRLDRAGATYVLQNDVTSAGTCFVVAADGITLDLNQHVIIYGTGSSGGPDGGPSGPVHGVVGQACWDKAGGADPNSCSDHFKQLTIKNGAIREARENSAFSHAIRIGQGEAHGLTLEQLRIQIYSPSTAAILVAASGGGNRFRGIEIANLSQDVLNRHQLEGTAVKVIGTGLHAAPDLFEDIKISGGPQTGLVLTTPGSKITGANIALTGTFTNDFAVMLLGDGMTAEHNRIGGRSRGIQVDAANASVSQNSIRVFEEPLNREYGGCQTKGAFGIQLEARAKHAVVSRNEVVVRADACDGRAFRTTSVPAANANQSSQNNYRAVRQPGGSGKAVAVSFAAAAEAALNGDTLSADTWNVEIDWDGARDVVLNQITFVKGDNPSPDYATFALVPGTNDPQRRPNSATLRVIDPIFHNGASPDSYLMHPIGFGGWAAPAEYSVEWSYRLSVKSEGGNPIAGAQVSIADHHGVLIFRGTTATDGSIPVVVLKQFRRFNTRMGIEKESYTYRIRITDGKHQREFDRRLAAAISEHVEFP